MVPLRHSTTILLGISGEKPKSKSDVAPHFAAHIQRQPKKCSKNRAHPTKAVYDCSSWVTGSRSGVSRSAQIKSSHSRKEFQPAVDVANRINALADEREKRSLRLRRASEHSLEQFQR